MPANSSYTEIITTTLQKRSGQVKDNMEKNNGLLALFKKKKKLRRPISGGNVILEEISFAENSNAQSYSGYDTLGLTQQDVLTAAEYGIKQYAVPVLMSGLEELQNAGEEQVIDLMAARIENAEVSLRNKMSEDIYGDGTGNGGKAITGLGAAVVLTPTTGTVGGIDRASWTFWRNQTTGTLGALTSATIQAAMNDHYLDCSRGSDRPDIIIGDNDFYATFLASLQTLQRFTATDEADLGFSNVKYLGATVIADGGIGGYQATKVAHFLNSNFIHWRPHSQRDFVPLKGDRMPTNQDAKVVWQVWAGNLSYSGMRFHGYFKFS